MANKQSKAMHSATHRTAPEVNLPVVGPIPVPAPDELAYLAGIGLLAALEVLEWPVAIVLGLGHALASSRRSRFLHEFGDALEEA